jgi:hypothetical protein
MQLRDYRVPYLGLGLRDRFAEDLGHRVGEAASPTLLLRRAVRCLLAEVVRPDPQVSEEAIWRVHVCGVKLGEGAHLLRCSRTVVVGNVVP